MEIDALFERHEIEKLLTSPLIPLDRKMFYAISVFTGGRFGEVAALQCSDYAASLRPLGRIPISRSYSTKAKRVKPTKTGAVKDAPVHPTLAALLVMALRVARNPRLR